MTNYLSSIHTQQSLSVSTEERGVSLVIVMIFLVILSGLGITAMQSSTFSARIARNESDRNVAFQAAEAALRDAENDIAYKRFDHVTPCSSSIVGCRTQAIEGLLNFDAACTAGLCAGGASVTPFWETASIWDASGNSVAYGSRTGAAALPVVSSQPRYLIEGYEVGIEKSAVYRVTAVGFGANASTQVMLQTAVKP
jgi:type IV pilus assembly protein PilX